MAYAATTTYRDPEVVNGRTHHCIRVEEIDAANGSETSFRVPRFGTVVGFRSVVVSGDADTAQAALGTAASFVADTLDHIETQDTTYASINDNTVERYYAPTGRMYLRSGVNAGTNNVVHTDIFILEGWRE